MGAQIGRWWAPVIARISEARHARMFHPVGHTFAGQVAPVDGGRYEPLGRELTGRVLARLSGALWRREREHLEVLGLAMRFRPGDGPPLDERPAAGDTDLLTATIRSPLTTLVAPLTTDARDFVTNRYWAVSPFVHPVGRFELRLSPIDPPTHALGPTRAERLYNAVAAGRAGWWLEARRTLHLRWKRVARIELTAPIELDQEALEFDPFRGVLEPVGLVHAIRRAAYAASQLARPVAAPGQ